MSPAGKCVSLKSTRLLGSPCVSFSCPLLPLPNCSFSHSGQVLTLSLLNLLSSKFVNNLFDSSSRGILLCLISSCWNSWYSSYEHLSPFTSGQFSVAVSFSLGLPMAPSCLLCSQSVESRASGTIDTWSLMIFSPGGAVLVFVGVQWHPWPLPDSQENPLPKNQNVSRYKCPLGDKIFLPPPSQTIITIECLILT